MPKSSNQKLKLLYIKDFFESCSDEEHFIKVDQIISMLEKNGICAERKSIYNDIEQLRVYGMDIQLQQGKYGGYYLAEHSFELPELKLLVDSIQSSKFITGKKSGELIKKLETLCSKYQASQLSRQMIVMQRIKTMNESIYYNVDAIYLAISMNKKISFKYFVYDVDKKRVFKRDGEKYVVSPFAFMFDDENYYLLAYDDEAGIIKHYRVDRIVEISQSDEPREGEKCFEQTSSGVYSSKLFSMFGGNVENVKIEFNNYLAGVVIDRFGSDIIMMKSDSDHFIVRADIALSAQFYAWIFSFCGEARILSPQSVVDGMAQHIEAVKRSIK